MTQDVSQEPYEQELSPSSSPTQTRDSHAAKYTNAAAYNFPHDSEALNNVAVELMKRYWVHGRVEDLDGALQFWQEAVHLTLSTNLERPRYLSNLGAGLYARYARTGAMEDLEAAVTAFREAVNNTPLDDPERSGRLNNLGAGLQARYGYTGAMEDLEAAIVALQEVVAMTPPNDPERSGRLNNLGAGLQARYGHTGAKEDLEAAIAALQEAVNSMSPDDPERPGYLGNLGGGLHDRYARAGSLEDLEAAILIYQEAVTVTSLDNPERSKYLDMLGKGLYDRYGRIRGLGDLEAAIAILQEAVATAPPDAPDHSGYLSNLGAGLHARYIRTGALEDLEASIAALQESVATTPIGSPEQSRRLSSLGAGLRYRYIRTGAREDLEASIAALQESVAMTLIGSPEQPRHLSNLGTGLYAQYTRTGALEDLEAAIAAFQQAIQVTQLDSRDYPLYLYNLGLTLHNHYVHTGEIADLREVIKTWEASWSFLETGFLALPVAYQLGQQRQEADPVAPLILALMELADLHHPSGRIVRRRAFEVAEGSKSRLLTQLVSRGPLPLPSGLSPTVATREQQLLAHLIALDTQALVTNDHLITAQEDTGHLGQLRQRQETLSELNQLWTKVASMGQEGRDYVTLRRGEAPTWQTLTRLAKELGPTTVLLSFFVTLDRVLLFLLRADWRVPRVVDAPLDQTGWNNLVERFFREVHRYTPGQRRGETWEQPLHPLLTKAQNHLVGAERLILAPAGNGHLLPWAVLAEHVGWLTPDGETMPLVTLPALGVLPLLRRRPHMKTAATLVVGNPGGDLPYAEIEANEVAEHFGTKPLLGAAATKSDVLTRLPDATLIHLATHAFFDSQDPLESGIVLADGVLTAREVLEYRLQADLLVLSACESGQVGSLGGEELAGLSQAFLQAGVRSLLVSLWRVNDSATAALMQSFYAARQAGVDKALALRQAMSQVQKDRRWTHPHYWGAFVLLGDWN